MNEAGKTDWRAILTAAGLFWTIVGGVLVLHDNYLLGLVDQRIAAHSTAARDSRDAFYRDIQQRADDAADGIGKTLSDLKDRCSAMQQWAKGVDSTLETLGRWRDKCSVKMGGMEESVSRNTADIQKLEDKLERLEHGRNPNL